MCGICGKLSWNAPPDPEIVYRMNSQLSHRGPDAKGVTSIGEVVLGHRRLSIIDLSPLGTQPMSDCSGQIWIVYNGEIYNYMEIRSELVLVGAVFRSKSDTEVVIEAYKRWGTGCLQRFNGMFAFAIWDNRSKTLFIARDRLGKKPLFYKIFPDGGIVFASELKALLEDPSVSNKLNCQALSHYLSLNYTLSSECIIKGVCKLAPAHYLIIERDRPYNEICYWNLSRCFQSKRQSTSEHDLSNELRNLIDDAVRIRLVSDVPLGVFLSGGVDSSTVVASMCNIQNPKDVYSFSVGFQEKGFSELNEAREVAEAFGVNHNDKLVKADSLELLRNIVYYADEPFADTSMIPTYLLAEFTRKYVTVALSGDGGDEIFAGYETYTADKIHYMTQWIPRIISGALYNIATFCIPASYGKVGFDYKIRQFLQGHILDFPRSHYHWRTIFSREEKNCLIRPSYNSILCKCKDAFEFFEEHRKLVSDCHYLDQAMYVDIKTWLADDILVKTDRMTMAHSLEARSPLLDFRIVEFAASLPICLKMKGFQKKYLLKKSQNKRISPKILNRRKKGFNAPIAYWLGSFSKERFMKILNGSISSELFDKYFIEKLWDDHHARKQDNSYKILGLINFSLWSEKFSVQI